MLILTLFLFLSWWGKRTFIPKNPKEQRYWNSQNLHCQKSQEERNWNSQPIWFTKEMNPNFGVLHLGRKDSIIIIGQIVSHKVWFSRWNFLECVIHRDHNGRPNIYNIDGLDIYVGEKARHGNILACSIWCAWEEVVEAWWDKWP